ncbi:hypothetical protein QUB75_02790 [Microcoleus sp. K1-B6]|uniref:hypothetical protein n=1 Tax=unclassified Microcoleus TaxID=2642155 RepID=UPI002FD726E7
MLDVDSILRPTLKRGFDLRGKFGNAQCTEFNGFNGWVLREEVKREEVKREARGFFPLPHSPTLSLSQVKIQNSLTVNCSIVQSHQYRLRNFNVRPDARYFNRQHSPGVCPSHLCLFAQRPIANNKMQTTIAKA